MIKEFNTINFSLVQQNKTATRLYTILQKWVPFVDSQYDEYSQNSNCGHFFGGSYFYSVETAFPMYVYSVLGNFGEYDEKITGVPKKELIVKAVKALKYLCLTHDLGPTQYVREKSDNVYANGTKWGGKGDEFFRASAMGRTCTMLSICALLLWDYLDQDTISLVEAIVSQYATRWSNEIPRVGTYFDTQSEENAWTAIGISSALILYKSHPDKELWSEGFKKWSINSVVTSKDRMNTASYLGKSLRNYWMKGVTFHPDFTNENHSFVHPSYTAAAIILRAESAILFKMTDNEIPETVYWNNLNIYHKTAKNWFQEDGLLIPVQGQDWWYTRYHERHLFHGVMSLFHNEDYSTHFETICIDYMEKMQNSHRNGCLLEEKHDQKIDEYGHYSLKHMEHGCVMSIVYSFLLHTFFGENKTDITTETIQSELSGVYEYPFGSYIINRNKTSFSSFSWRNKVMALNLPKEGFWTITPLTSSMTGEIMFANCPIPFSISNQKDIRDCEKRNITILDQGFGATVSIIRGDRQITQHVSFISLPNGYTLYNEKFDINKNCEVTSFHTGLIGVRNENISEIKEHAKGFRDIFTNTKTYHYVGYFGGEKNDTDILEHNGYVNVDNRMGYLIYDGNASQYINKHVYTSWRGVEDLLILNCNMQKEFKSGEKVNCFSLIALPNQTKQQTEEIKNDTIQYQTLTDNTFLFELTDYLLYTNFCDKEITIKGESICGKEITLYEGETTIVDTKLTRLIKAPAFTSSYIAKKASITLTKECTDLHVMVINDKIVISNENLVENTLYINTKQYTINAQTILQVELGE